MDAILRKDAEALVQTQLINSIMQDTPKSSIVMQLGKRLPNMTSNQTRVPVLSMLPMAYWVNGDTGYKQTSHQAWDSVYLVEFLTQYGIELIYTRLTNCMVWLFGHIVAYHASMCALLRGCIID